MFDVRCTSSICQRVASVERVSFLFWDVGGLRSAYSVEMSRPHQNITEGKGMLCVGCLLTKMFLDDPWSMHSLKKVLPRPKLVDISVY